MARPRNALKRVRDICLALPEASEKEAWGRPTFRIRGKKMFAMYMDNHHDDGRLALWVTELDWRAILPLPANEIRANE